VPGMGAGAPESKKGPDRGKKEVGQGHLQQFPLRPQKHLPIAGRPWSGDLAPFSFLHIKGTGLGSVTE
jgi:hypothetical protein